MRIFRRLLLLAGLLGSLAFGPAAMAEPVLNVQPPVGPPGTLFLFFASGFGNQEGISIWLNAPDGRVLPATAQRPVEATSFGDATWTWIAPDDAPLGNWQMVAHGRDSGTERVLPFVIGTAEQSGNSGEGYNITPSHGSAGTLFHFFATGFEAGEGFDITVSGPAGALDSPSLLTSKIVSDDGRIDGTWSSPSNAAPGVWQIVVTGAHSGFSRAIPATIDAAPANQPAMIIQPSLGVPGARFVVSASGFQADELISVWLNAPDGRVLPATLEGRAQAGPDGHAGWAWIAPDDAPLGNWQMVAHGRDSGIELVVNFTLQR